MCCSLHIAALTVVLRTNAVATAQATTPVQAVVLRTNAVATGILLLSIADNIDRTVHVMVTVSFTTHTMCVSHKQVIYGDCFLFFVVLACWLISLLVCLLTMACAVANVNRREEEVLLPTAKRDPKADHYRSLPRPTI